MLQNSGSDNRSKQLFELYRKIQFHLSEPWTADTIQNIYNNISEISSLYSDIDPELVINKMVEDLQTIVVQMAKDLQISQKRLKKMITLATESLKKMVLHVKDKAPEDAKLILEKEYFLIPAMNTLQKNLEEVFLITEQWNVETLHGSQRNIFDACEAKLQTMQPLMEQVNDWLQRVQPKFEIETTLIQQILSKLSDQIILIENSIALYKNLKNDSQELLEKLESQSEYAFSETILEFMKKRVINERTVQITQYLNSLGILSEFIKIDKNIESSMEYARDAYRKYYDNTRADFMDAVANFLSYADLESSVYENKIAAIKKILPELTPQQMRTLTEVYNNLREFSLGLNELKKGANRDSMQLDVLSDGLNSIENSLGALSSQISAMEEIVENEFNKNKTVEILENLKEERETLIRKKEEILSKLQKTQKLQNDFEKDIDNTIQETEAEAHNLKEIYEQKQKVFKLTVEKHKKRKDNFNAEVEQFNRALHFILDKESIVKRNALSGLKELRDKLKKQDLELKSQEALSLESLGIEVEAFCSMFEQHVSDLKVDILVQEKNPIEIIELMEETDKELDLTKSELIYAKEESPLEKVETVEKVKSLIPEKPLAFTKKADTAYKAMTLSDFKEMEKALKTEEISVLASVITRIYLNNASSNMASLLLQIQDFILQEQPHINREILKEKITLLENIFKSVEPYTKLEELKKWRAFYCIYNITDYKALLLEIEDELKSMTTIEKGLEGVEVVSKEDLKSMEVKLNLAVERLTEVSQDLAIIKPIEESLKSIDIKSAKTGEIFENISEKTQFNNTKREKLIDLREALLKKVSEIIQEIDSIAKNKVAPQKEYMQQEIENGRTISELSVEIEKLKSENIQYNSKLESEKRNNESGSKIKQSQLSTALEKRDKVQQNLFIAQELEEKLTTSKEALEEKKGLLNSNSNKKEELISELEAYEGYIKRRLEEIRFKVQMLQISKDSKHISENMFVGEEIEVSDQLDLNSIISSFSEIKKQDTIEQLENLDSSIQIILKKDWPSGASIYAETFSEELNNRLDPKPIEFIKSKQELQAYYILQLDAQRNKILGVSEKFIKILKKIPKQDSESELSVCSNKEDEILKSLEQNTSGKKIFIDSINRILDRKFTTLVEVEEMYNNEIEKQKALLINAYKLAQEIYTTLASIENTTDEKVLHNDIKHKVNADLLQREYGKLTTSGAKAKFFSDLTRELQKANLLKSEASIQNAQEISSLMNALIDAKLNDLNKEKARKAAEEIATLFKEMLKLESPDGKEGKELNQILEKFSKLEGKFNEQVDKVDPSVEKYFGDALKTALEVKGISQGKSGNLIPAEGENITPLQTKGEVKDLWMNTKNYRIKLAKMREEISTRLEALDLKREQRGIALATLYIGFVEEMRSKPTFREVSLVREKYDKEFSGEKLWEADGAKVISTMIEEINKKGLGFKVNNKAEIFSKYADAEGEKTKELEGAIKKKGNDIDELIKQYVGCKEEKDIIEITEKAKKVLEDDTLKFDNVKERNLLCDHLTGSQGIYHAPAIFTKGEVKFTSPIDIQQHIDELDRLYKEQLQLANTIANAIQAQLDRIQEIQENNMQDLSNSIPHMVGSLLEKVDKLTQGAKDSFS